MTEQQKLQFNRMYNTLKRIANDFDTSEKIMGDCDLSGCLDFEEEITTNYDNIQTLALFAIQGVEQIL